MRFHILGPVEVRDDDNRLLPMGGPQQRAVVALLLVQANQVVSTDRIATQLWGDTPPATARALVQGCIAGLRRSLPPGDGDVLLTRPPGYLLRIRPGDLDLDRFEELVEAADRFADEGTRASLERGRSCLREALSLWRGPAFDGVELDACAAEAARLAERRLTVVEQRINLDLRLGAYAELSAELWQLVREHPLRERLWAQLITALYQAQRQADALDAYRQVRRALIDELGVEPGAALQRLHQAILTGDDLPMDAPAGPEPSAGPVVPAQLPAAVAGFTGRKSPLRRLDALLDGADPDAVPIVVLCGTAGVGKTALAVQWAHTVRDRFPGGQLYVDLRGFSTFAPLRPTEALAGFLGALGVPADRIPAGAEHAAALYRTLLSRRKVLVVLDNASDIAQVRPLLPGGPGGLVLVTSRDKLGGLVAHNGAVPVPLDVLEPDEAQTLLTRILGRDVPCEDLAMLARACAYLPLALRIAAANLALHPQRRVAGQLTPSNDRLDALAVRGDDERAVRATFDISYGYLDPSARRLFRHLGLVPGVDVTAADAEALLGDTDRDTAEQLLGRLTDAHLIDEHTTGRYGCHDLLWLYAGERARADEPPEDRDAALDRLYARYVGRARAAADMLYPHMLRLPGGPVDREPGFPDEATALDWLEEERPNLVLAVRCVVQHGPRRAGWLLADALRGYFHLRRYLGDWFTVADAALAAARDDGDLAAQAAARHSLGTAYRSIGEHRTALRHYAAALRLARDCDWPESQATSLGNLGIVYHKLGRLTAAARHLDAALALDRKLGRPAGEANNLSLLASVYYEMGRLPDAAAQFVTALALNTAIGSRHGEALVHSGLGDVYRELGRHDEARRHLTEALHRYDQVGDRDGTAMTHCSLSALETAEGRPQSAYTHALTALDLAGRTGDRRTEAIARNALGASDIGLGRPEAALGQHQQALALAGGIASRRLMAESMIGLAVAHGRLGDPDQAADLARQALDLAGGNGLTVVADIARRTLADLTQQSADRGTGPRSADQAVL